MKYTYLHSCDEIQCEGGALICTMKGALSELNALELRASELEAQLTGAAQVVTTLTAERDKARLELQHIRTMLDNGDRDDFTAFDMARRMNAKCYEQAQRITELEGYIDRHNRKWHGLLNTRSTQGDA